MWCAYMYKVYIEHLLANGYNIVYMWICVVDVLNHTIVVKYYIIVAVELFFFFLFAWMPLFARICVRACVCMTFFYVLFIFFLTSSWLLVWRIARCKSTKLYQYGNTTTTTTTIHQCHLFTICRESSKIRQMKWDIFSILLAINGTHHLYNVIMIEFIYSFYSSQYSCNDLLNHWLFELITFEICTNCTRFQLHCMSILKLNFFYFDMKTHEHELFIWSWFQWCWHWLKWFAISFSIIRKHKNEFKSLFKMKKTSSLVVFLLLQENKLIIWIQKWISLRKNLKWK